MTNIFMIQVRDSLRFSWKNFFKYFKYKKSRKKFENSIRNGSPSFGVLWNFAEFIQYAEIIYSFDNNKNGKIYSSREYNPGQIGFKISTPDMVIKVKLWSDDQLVGIDIENTNGNKVKSNYEFVNGNWTIDPDEYDILHIDRVIEIINNHMLYLLNWCICEKNNIDWSDY